MSTEPQRVIGFGHPLLDITSCVESSLLDKYKVELGSCNLAADEQLPLFEELSQRRDVEFVPGGASMNSIRVARWLMTTDACTFVGSLGDDEFGCILERALSRAGVKSHFMHHEEKPTGTCACLIVERERSLLANLGAALEFNMEHLMSASVQAAIADAHLFYLEGFFMNTQGAPTNATFLGEHCVNNNKLLLFNLSAPYLSYIFKERLAGILPYTDFLLGNHEDFSAYAESVGWDSSNINDVLDRLVGQPKKNAERSRIVIMTNGADATRLAQHGKPVQEFPIVKVAEEDIVDTNGAGDAFVGGLLSQLALGKPLEDCIRIGHIAASVVIRQNGCSLPEERPVLS
jgi:adenosine kinase